MQLKNNNYSKCALIISEKLLLYSHDYGLINNTVNEIQKLMMTLDIETRTRLTSLHARLQEEKSKVVLGSGIYLIYY